MGKKKQGDSRNDIEKRIIVSWAKCECIRVQDEYDLFVTKRVEEELMEKYE